MLYETVWQESSAASTWDQRHCIEMVEGFLIVLVNVVVAIGGALDHGIEILRRLRHWPPLPHRLLSFDLFPFIDAARHMNPNTGCSILLSANVANHGLRTLTIVTRHLTNTKLQ